MKRLMFGALTFSLLAANPAAYADGWHGNGNDNYNGHGRPAWHEHRPAYHPVPYRPYYPYPQHKNNDNHSEWPAYVVGGLVLGALLTNAFPGSRPTAYYAGQSSAPTVEPDSGRTLLRDINGNCYERQTDGAGNEMRTELPASACAW